MSQESFAQQVRSHYSSLFSLKEAVRRNEHRLSPLELEATEAVMKVCWLKPRELMFTDPADFFESEVLQQMRAEFQEGLVVELRNDDSYRFFYGRQGQHHGVWRIGQCPYCRAVTVLGGMIGDLIDLHWSMFRGGPRWHNRPCKVVRADNPEPCH